MSKDSVLRRFHLSGTRDRGLVMLALINCFKTLNSISKCAAHISVCYFIVIYVIITSIFANGHNTPPNTFLSSPFGGHMLFNLSLNSLDVWDEYPGILSGTGDIVEYGPDDRTTFFSEQHFSRRRRRPRRQQNQRNRLFTFNEMETSTDTFYSDSQNINDHSIGKRRVGTSNPSTEAWSNGDFWNRYRTEATESVYNTSPQPSKVLNPVIIDTYRINSPCLHYATHWVRNSDNCSVFFVCARNEVAAVLTCPNAYVWSNRVTNCVPVHSRWDDCTPKGKGATTSKGRRKLAFWRSKHSKKNGYVPWRTTTTQPIPSSREPKYEPPRKVGLVRRNSRRRKIRRGYSTPNTNQRRNDANAISPSMDNSGSRLFTRHEKTSIWFTTPSPQIESVTKEETNSRPILQSRRRGQLKRKRFKDRSNRFRFRKKDTGRKMWFSPSTTQLEEKTTSVPKVVTETQKQKRRFLNRRRHRKGYRKRLRDRQSQRDMTDLKRHTIPEPSKEIKDNVKSSRSQWGIETSTDYNNVPTRWWKHSTTEQSTMSTTTTSLPHVYDSIAITQQQYGTQVLHTVGQNATRQNFVPECGISSTSLIIGGMPVSHDRWPWLLSLHLSWANRHVCGGTLVHPQWLITAAHCVADPDLSRAADLKVVFGDVESAVQVDFIMKHPDFVNGDNFPNDIAMVRLSKPADVSGFKIRHACLPSNDWGRTEWEKCWIMGWGEAKETFKSELKELEVKIWKKTECSARWGWKRILNSHMCVGNGDSGACNGDSGGPLICRRDGYHYLTGVTSWGVSGCQTMGYPAVFIKVAYYRKWIHDVIDKYTP